MKQTVKIDFEVGLTDEEKVGIENMTEEEVTKSKREVEEYLKNMFRDEFFGEVKFNIVEVEVEDK